MSTVFGDFDRIIDSESLFCKSDTVVFQLLAKSILFLNVSTFILMMILIHSHHCEPRLYFAEKVLLLLLYGILNKMITVEKALLCFRAVEKQF